MAHGKRKDPRDERHGGETYPRSADASQYQPSETAPPHSQCLGYAPWNAPPPHPGVQEPFCAVSCANDSAPGYGAWREVRPDFPPVPTMGPSQYTDQGAGNANGTISHSWNYGNRDPTGATRVYAPPLASDSQTNYMAGQGPTPVANVYPEASTNAQFYAPAASAAVPSESIGSLARRLILDLGTRVNGLNIEASGRGGLKVTITLETADIV